ncbi:HAMP domain-containing sensor histidine kinase [uncultured Dokdonia sp.]|uniref:sensor histidine kinase n=1 Tax=uncultured Dokdonia sp. TaxID=575653 RepID=UPI002613F492|nr:HAMP domain-containing sensor histidine kinase [uncultured Dokdonia sp.]
MSLSLIGIIFVQGYWILDSVEAKREQFSFRAKRAVVKVAEKIQDREFKDYYYSVDRLIDSIGVLDDLTFDEYFFINEDPITNDVFLYRNGILQQDFKLSAPAFDRNLDSVEFKRYFNLSSRQILSRGSLDGNLSSQGKIQEISKLSDFEKVAHENLISDVLAKKPIHKRASVEEIQRIMTLELVERDLETDFEFGIFDNDLLTKVRSENFEFEGSSQFYQAPIFIDKNGETDYYLYAEFPGEKKIVISSIIGMIVLSVIFTLIIVIAYSSALHQLNKQRQISQIKTDFINNMTHEFKTPIATINLALDAVKNPKISNNPEKVSYYHKMIRDENKRMHAQVENVLRISKLEKNELDIRKERYKLHDIIEDAVQHVSLIVEDRNGYIEMHLDAPKSSVLANESHFTNVIVNMLENAVKYSTEEPKIDVSTENVKNFIYVKIKDQGDGMSKAAQRKVFEKFYREHSGNIHNVKGHGLGLAYARQIVEDHQGEIFVESEKGKGSTFIIKLPLIS